MPHHATLILPLVLSLILTNGLPRTPARATKPSTDKPAPAKATGRSCAACPAGARERRPDSPDALAGLGRRTQTSPLLPLHDTVAGATVNLVSTATGRLSFAITDLSLHGPTPLVFQRTYASDRTQDVGLGRGWAFVFDDYINLEGDAATLVTATAPAVNFRRDGVQFRRHPEAPGRHQRFALSGADLIVEQDGELTRLYRRVGGAFRLVRIALHDGGEIDIARDDAGRVTSIGDGAAALTLHWAGGQHPRLSQVSDHTGRRVSFQQRGGALEAVTDAAGARWAFDYEGGSLARVVDPVGRVVLRVRYDAAGRAAEAGDAYGLTSFAYGAPLPAVSPRTAVTDPLGAETIFEHTAWGGLAGTTDDEGQSTRLEYNAARRLVRVTDALGNEQGFAYDAQHRLTRKDAGGVSRVYERDAAGRVVAETAGGERTEYTLDAAGRIASARAGDPGRSYRVARDARGRAAAITPDAGPALAFEYDAAGRQSAFVFGGARHEMVFDAAGRLAAKRMPDGTVQRFEYDARGLLTRESDSRGRAVEYERDAAGAVIGVYGANGRWVRAARDAAGRVVKLTASDGKSRHFVYDARGALTGYLDARGRGRQLKYDRRGRLLSIEDSEGGRVSYRSDRAGRPVAARRVAEATPGRVAFLPATLGPVAPAQGVDCFFDDTFQTDPYGSTVTLDPSICGDPFGDIFGSGGLTGTGYGGTYGGSLGGGTTGETCQQCQSRHYEICQLDFQSCLMTALGLTFAAAVACAALFAPSGPAGASIAASICAIIMTTIEGERCRNQVEACRLRIRDNCSERCG